MTTLPPGAWYAGLAQLYAPSNARFEVRLGVLFVASNRTTGDDYHTGFGDLQIVPRFILSETEDVTQSFNVTIRTPTGQPTLTLTPGFRSYLGWNWYLLGGVVVPVTNPQPFDYQVLGALMLVF